MNLSSKPELCLSKGGIVHFARSIQFYNCYDNISVTPITVCGSFVFIWFFCCWWLSLTLELTLSLHESVVWECKVVGIGQRTRTPLVYPNKHSRPPPGCRGYQLNPSQLPLPRVFNTTQPALCTFKPVATQDTHAHVDTHTHWQTHVRAHTHSGHIAHQFQSTERECQGRKH